jgi:hypothetical protein
MFLRPPQRTRKTHPAEIHFDATLWVTLTLEREERINLSCCTDILA